METKTNTLLSNCREIFRLIIKLNNDSDAVDFSALRAEVEQKLRHFEYLGMQNKIALEQVQHAKYALAALIDEAVLLKGRSKAGDWMKKPLQLQYFGEHLAGEGFFKRLEQLRLQPQSSIDALEVYYYCLQLGFQGKYAKENTEKLLALQVDLRGQISAIRGVVDSQLSDKEVLSLKAQQNLRNYLPFWVIASVSLCIIFLIYASYSVMINHQADKYLHQIEVAKTDIVKKLDENTKTHKE